MIINKLNSDHFENNRLICAGTVNYIRKPYALKLIADVGGRQKRTSRTKINKWEPLKNPEDIE